MKKLSERFISWFKRVTAIPEHPTAQPFRYETRAAGELKVGDFLYCGYILSITASDVYSGDRVIRAGYGNRDITVFVAHEDEQFAVRLHNPEYKG